MCVCGNNQYLTLSCCQLSVCLCVFVCLCVSSAAALLCVSWNHTRLSKLTVTGLSHWGRPQTCEWHFPTCLTGDRKSSTYVFKYIIQTADEFRTAIRLEGKQGTKTGWFRPRLESTSFHIIRNTLVAAQPSFYIKACWHPWNHKRLKPGSRIFWNRNLLSSCINCQKAKACESASHCVPLWPLPNSDSCLNVALA